MAGPWRLGAGRGLPGSGCSTLGYYAQPSAGHLDLLRAPGRSPTGWPTPPRPPLRERLQLAQRMRDFAVTELACPTTQLPPLCRPEPAAAVWNVVAAPELSLTLKTWCFPVLGCVGYRGYFDRAAADALAAELKAQGWKSASTACRPTQHAGLDQLAGRRPAAQHLHPLARGRAGAADLPRAGAPGGLRGRRHRVQRELRHRGGAPGRARWLAWRSGRALRRAADLGARARRLPRADAAHPRGAEALYASDAADADKRSARPR
jgi:predicted aminopeptidase